MENQNEVSSLLAEFTARISDIEERLRLFKDKLDALNRTVLSETEEIKKEIVSLKEKTRSLNDQFERLKESIKHIIEESSDFVRREELKSFERLFKVLDPLKFVTEEDVRKIIKEEKRKKEW
ncbi:hypothetical protein B6U82_00900 [Candidatus Pacearchaeota archaeon ex4484_31]|nr:MAG: hypothetical protein B6U82_00900 [Candidatus Pacearchaeota archaeon ex4484_31]